MSLAPEERLALKFLVLLFALLLFAAWATGCAAKPGPAPHPRYAGVVSAAADVGSTLVAAEADGKTVLSRNAEAAEIVEFLETQITKLLAP